MAILRPLPSALPLIDLALAAGREIMRIYAAPISAALKPDQSPVTEADLAAERIILDGLQRIAAGTPVISEEAASRGEAPNAGDAFYLVDPLDGTREFISRNGEFTVNIARIELGHPISGIVLAPALGRIFWGDVSTGSFQGQIESDGHVSWRAIRVRTPPPRGLTVVASRSHRDSKTEEFIAARKPPEIVSVGSSLKFCLIAASEADLYPRFGRTMEWDTAAGHAVLAAAGGKVVDESGTPLRYGKPGFENPAFIASA
jgi:3'(2'), 5'-bisphosphate nucleotidase